MKEEIAKSFGSLLDHDKFSDFKEILAPDCKYYINEDILSGKDEIAGLYETNMKAGKKKFDELVWGQSKVTRISDNTFDVHFSDYLKHKGISHRYECKQRIKVSDAMMVIEIRHMELPGKREALNEFYKKVGLV